MFKTLSLVSSINSRRAYGILICRFKQNQLFVNSTRFCFSLTTSGQDVISSEDTQMYEDIQVNEFEFKNKKNKSKVHDILKVVTGHLQNTSLNDSIRALQLAATYKSYPNEFLKEVETKFMKNLSSLDQNNLSKVIFAFFELNYNSK